MSIQNRSFSYAMSRAMRRRVCLLDGVVNMALDKKAKEVGNGVNATIDGDTKLARGEQEYGKVGAIVGKDDGTCKVMPVCTNTNGGVEYG